MAPPKLRRTASDAPALEASFESGEAYEGLLALAMFTGDEPEDSYTVGRRWFTEARRAASPALRAALKQLVGSTGSRWFFLLGLVHEAGGARDIAVLLDRLGSTAPEEILLVLLGGRLPRLRLEEGRRLVEQALGGDLRAAEKVSAKTFPRERSVIRQLAALGPSRAKALTIEVLERWQDEVFGPQRPELMAVIEADLAAKARSTRGLAAHDLIDRVTAGISYEGEAGIDRVLLVPTAVSRPWIVICDWDSTKFFCYPANPGSSGSADQPDPDLVLVYRALGDETRLRILRELVGADRRIADLASSLGLAKSTIHSHLTLLRRAGLVKLSIGADKRYGLRKGRPDLNRLLAGYLEG